jgi:D-inositol-3-phosphate glycosyltransferase
MRVSLLTGADDPGYAIPLAGSLAQRGIQIEFIGNDEMEGASGLRSANIEYLNLRGSQDSRARLPYKMARVLRYYQRLVCYASRTEATLFHILWLNKFEVLDRTILNMFYKLKRKRLVFTAHNVNVRTRDGNDTWVNRTSLRAMYALLDHIFVHSEPWKDELVHEYGVQPSKVSVIPFGVNTYVPETPLSKWEARRVLGLTEAERVLLFFGQIAPYKGLDVLLEALRILSGEPQPCTLIIAGRAKPGRLAYWQALKAGLERDARLRVLVKDTHIPNDTVSIFFRAADALILPYRSIYQSGPLSLAYRFGLPAIATRVGAFRGDVIPDVTGLLCEPEDPGDLARAIRQYFAGDLYHDGERTHQHIREIAAERYSWDRISGTISQVYAGL